MHGYSLWLMQQTISQSMFLTRAVDLFAHVNTHWAFKSCNFDLYLVTAFKSLEVLTQLLLLRVRSRYLLSTS